MRLTAMVLMMVACSNEREAVAPPAPNPPTEAREERRYEPNEPRMPDKPSESATPAPKLSGSRCLKKAKQLVSQAKKCGISYSRTAKQICAELFTVDNFTDDQTVGRMDVFTRDGCGSLRVAIENDRI